MQRSLVFRSLRVTVLAVLVLAIGGGLLRAQTVSLDFETIGQLTNNFIEAPTNCPGRKLKVRLV